MNKSIVGDAEWEAACAEYREFLEQWQYIREHGDPEWLAVKDGDGNYKLIKKSPYD